MSSVLSLIISLLCLISSLNMLIVVVVDGRHIGVIHEKHDQYFTTQDIVKPAQVNDDNNTPSNNNDDDEDKTKVKVHPSTRKMSKNDIHNNARNFDVTNKNVRQNYEVMLHNNSKIKKSKLSKNVTWRVPKKNNGVQERTSFNQDYAPPKVHPPTHN
ncbi:hypothetical protein vseg_018940 [Gypsophila vaccaria]